MILLIYKHEIQIYNTNKNLFIIFRKIFFIFKTFYFCAKYYCIIINKKLEIFSIIKVLRKFKSAKIRKQPSKIRARFSTFCDFVYDFSIPIY